MTFDALGLTHTCCHHLRENGLFVIKDREEEEIKEIQEEEQTFLERFECLVEEFNLKFNCLGLSILDFLQEHWHPRVMDFLSQRDLHDEEHVAGASRLGVHLRLYDATISDRVSLSIGPKVWEVAEHSEESSGEDSMDEFDSESDSDSDD
jgi:hypothetical protein